MGFELIAFLCVCNLISFGVSLRTISTQASTNVLNVLELKIVQPIDDPTDYDCVDIYKQPAFNHPLLKNHKIQIEPNFELRSKKISSEDGGCPKGKVPIKRMNNSFDQFHQFSSEHPGEHFATLDTEITTQYHGIGASISVYDPSTKMDQVSMAQIWVQSGPPFQLNNVQAGWAVHPKIYGDGRTYLTVFWTADGHIKTGCYNMICPGFVQVDAHFYPGQPIDRVSVNGGRQYIIDLKIYQDQTSKNWWLITGDTKIGYWPKELFNYLVNGGFVFRYGGRTTNGQDGTSPPMGSGHFATKLTDQSCFFSNMKLLNWGLTKSDIPSHLVKVNVDSLNCYTLNYLSFQDQQMGQVLTFGGPGGYCGV